MTNNLTWKMIVIINFMFSPSLIFASKAPDEVHKAKILNKTYRMQVPFIENKGQVEDDSISFYAKTFGGTVFVGRDGTLTYSLPFEDKGGIVIKEVLTESKVEVKGLEPSPTRINYFKGKDQSKWKTDIPSYNSVSLGEVYKGVELTLRAYGKNVEKLFTVKPGTDPGKIKVKLEGAKVLSVNEKGELEVVTEHGPVTFTKPLAYQEIDGKRIEVEVAYTIEESEVRSQRSEEKNPKSAFQNPKSLQSPSLHHSNTPTLPYCNTPQLLSYSFKVASYDRTKPLIIDPLLASTFIGGSDSDVGYSLTLDGSGNVYVTGSAQEGFPTTPGAYNEIYNGVGDVFISKLDSTLSSLLASTFIGGGSVDGGHSLAFDGSGNVYITGETYSFGFPTTPGAYDENHNGVYDVFVSKLDSTLSSLLASTFIGGGGLEFGYSLALDGSGNVYVTGYAESGFPTTPSAYDENHNGVYDVFVSKLNSNLTSLLASTFIGGSNEERGFSLALDASGNVYVTGYAQSGYPTTLSAYDESYNGGDFFGDVFVSKLNSNLNSLLASTFIGGVGEDTGRSLALDSTGNVYVTGQAESGFPTTPGAYNEGHNGGFYDVFVSKLNNTLSTLLASTFIGGGSGDVGYSLTLDGCANIYITGGTSAPNYPTTPGAYDESHNGDQDVFISKLDSTLSFLFQSTFIGGDNLDTGFPLVLDGSGNVYVTGRAGSGFPTTPGAYNEGHNGGFYDVFVSKLDSFLSTDSAGFQSGSFLSEEGIAFVFDADGDGELNVLCNQLMLCDGQIVEVDIWLSGYSGALSAIDYEFSWDSTKFDVQGITCNTADWNGECTADPSPPGSGSYNLRVSSTVPLSGPQLKLHTITFEVLDVTVPFVDAIYAMNGTVTPETGPPVVPVTTDGNIIINAICGGNPITCQEEDHCERMNEACPETGVTEVVEKFYWEPQGTQLYEGDTITFFATKKGYRTVTESFDPTLCDSNCFDSCYSNCAYAELHDCYLGCARGCACDVCANWDEEEVCFEYQNRIACSIKCYNDCFYSYDSETHTAEYERWCGYVINETITIKGDGDGDCSTGDPLDTFTLEGIGTAVISRSLPLSEGNYEICRGDTLVGGSMVPVTANPEFQCRVLIPTSSFIVTQGENATLSNIKVEADLDGDYTLSLERWNFDHTVMLPIPSSLQLPTPAEVAVTSGSGTFSLSAINPGPEAGKDYWFNTIIRAAYGGGETIVCEATFDYGLDGDSDGIFDSDDNCPNTTNPDQFDTFPPEGNDIGDACDCESDFNCDGNVDADDVTPFLADFGRSTFFNPCTNADPCNGDFNCDVNVDADDVTLFLVDFGRSQFFNPCPQCVVGNWCSY